MHKKVKLILECVEEDNVAIRNGGKGVLDTQYVYDAINTVNGGMDIQAFMTKYWDKGDSAMDNRIYDIVLE